MNGQTPPQINLNKLNQAMHHNQQIPQRTLQQPILNPQNLTIMNGVNQPQFIIQSQPSQPMQQQPQQLAFLVPIGTHYNQQRNTYYQPPQQPIQQQTQYYYPQPIPPQTQGFIPMFSSNFTSAIQHMHLPKFPLLPLLSTDTNHSANLSSASPSSQILSSSKLVKTEDCSDNDSQNSILSHSSKSTTNHKPQQYECSECGKTFKHKSNLKIHFVIHTDEALQCSHCGKRFARKSNLTQHLRVHTGERPFECRHCDKKFKQSHSLKDHIRTHTGEKPYECDICGKAFKVKHNMVVHKRLHTGEKPFECPLCLKKFASKSSLNGHTKKLHPNQWWSLHPESSTKKYDALLIKK